MRQGIGKKSRLICLLVSFESLSRCPPQTILVEAG